jgi:FkbM family methyltransferase
MNKVSKRIDGGNKTADQLLYRPFFEISCALSQHVRDNDLIAAPIGVVDCGVGRGFDPRLEMFGDLVSIVGIDADAQEIQNLRIVYKDMLNRGKLVLLNAALWSRHGKKTLKITKDADGYSLLSPHLATVENFPDPSVNEVIEEIEVDLTPLDAIGLSLESVDMIKLDVEGAELEILKGGSNTLSDGVIAVVIETHFLKLRENQALFPEVYEFLANLGFELYDLDIRRW